MAGTTFASQFAAHHWVAAGLLRASQSPWLVTTTGYHNKDSTAARWILSLQVMEVKVHIQADRVKDLSIMQL